MTLKEKILPLVADGSYVELTVRKIEQIADDFAIGFAEWSDSLKVGEWSGKTTKELLEIYKKENKL